MRGAGGTAQNRTEHKGKHHGLSVQLRTMARNPFTPSTGEIMMHSTFILAVRPAVGQRVRATTVVADTAAQVAHYAARRYGSSFPVTTAPVSGVWHLYNGTPDGGHAATPYGIILSDTPTVRAEYGIPYDAPARIVLRPGTLSGETITADGRTWGPSR